MKLGIVGLPNVGKSTLFNSLTKGEAVSANYPFATIDPNVGIVPVPDSRLEVLTKMYEAKQTVPAIIEFVDIAGLVKGASKGEGLGNKFLSNIREVDAIVHVVRCFEDDNIVHVEGGVNPQRDIETINLELIFSDIEILERRIAKTEKAAKADKTLKKDLDISKELKSILEEGKPARIYEAKDEDEELLIKTFNLLTTKPVIYGMNIMEEELQDGGENNPHVFIVKNIAASENATAVPFCAKLEEEIKDFTEEEKKDFLEDLGIKETGLDRLTAAGYDLLGLMSFLTAGEKEVRAWTIQKGTSAKEAGGKIHSDIERGFIRAEIVSFDDLVEEGSVNDAKAKGKLRSEGKEYIMQDGDVVLFRFNV
ncbi:MAG: redox-regulated ATPase YchF [Defluviitaleaceae bacterium]|nr:redox-regulated ATPase YchF [Defluviitaleaceae bacterium]